MIHDTTIGQFTITDYILIKGSNLRDTFSIDLYKYLYIFRSREDCHNVSKFTLNWQVAFMLSTLKNFL